MTKQHRANRFWTPEEMDLLIEHATQMHGDELAAMMCRTEDGVRCMATKLRVTIKRRPMPKFTRRRNLPPEGLTLALVAEECAAAKIKGASPARVLSGDRRKPLTWLRARAIRRLRELKYSTTVIGEEFGMDHSSVFYALNRTDLETHPGPLTVHKPTPLRSKLIAMSHKWNEESARTAIARAA